MKIPAPVFYFRRTSYHPRSGEQLNKPKWHLMLLGQDNEEAPKGLARYEALCGYTSVAHFHNILVRKVIRNRGLTCKICLRKYQAAGG